MIYIESPRQRAGRRVVSWEYALREEWTLKRLEDEYICAVLQSVGGQRERAASILGIDRRTLDQKILELTD
ncbi:MAG: hypothetical protein JSU87_01005 [Gemmatimonadota bacterium]|nr:MAG: hypothetical protein JSU87_01005 [Gemmatimonadota bacterium]